jgi:hypothetical protein
MWIFTHIFLALPIVIDYNLPVGVTAEVTYSIKETSKNMVLNGLSY